MENKTLIYQNIISDLSNLSVKKLTEVETFVKFLLFQNKQTEKKKELKTLSGIWKDLGFEKILDLDAEINVFRKKASKGILKKKL